MRYKHYFFDMDGTLCESRQTISMEMAAMLSIVLRDGADVVVISGAEEARIRKQLGGYVDVKYILAQSGAHAPPFWEHKIKERDEIAVFKHIKKIQKILRYDWGAGPTDPRFVENRGCQITFSLTSFDCNPEVKKDFDPTGRRRVKILENIPFEHPGMTCKVAGNTSLDYSYSDQTKGKNIERFLEKMGWSSSQCIYFGDRFFPGGNDESVVGVIKTVPVKDPKDLLNQIQAYL